MHPLALHEFHHELSAHFSSVNGSELVSHYGDWLAEHTALREAAGILDLSFRSRLCLTGNDRVRFLHGQVTNDVKKLKPGEGCYSALVTAKGKMQGDLNIYALQDELLLDFEPGLTATVSQRLEKFLVADDVQILDVTGHYGLLSVQGPKSPETIRSLGIFPEVPETQLNFSRISDPTLGELYLMNHPRVRSIGFDLFVPHQSLGAVADKLVAASRQRGGRACGWEALETARIEAGVPRFGFDMDETNLPLECGIAESAVSFQKGCYIGQEVINRIHTIGHVNRELRGLNLGASLRMLPAKGDKLFLADKEVGCITSSAWSPAIQSNIALGYVRRGVNQPGTSLILKTAGESVTVQIVELPIAR
jgi:folate-binding protein YgfZ